MNKSKGWSPFIKTDGSWSIIVKKFRSSSNKAKILE